MRLAACVAVALLAATVAAEAQVRPSRSSSRPPGMESQQQGPRSAYYGAPALAADPMVALERELPSLRVDLKITGEQSPYWDSFERAVRDVAELGRSKQKQLLAPLEADKPPPPAIALVRAWADDDRNRAAAMGELVPKLEALQATLSESQRKELDRRLVLSQTEPLSMTPPPVEAPRRAPQPQPR